jgi:hypothetical protein
MEVDCYPIKGKTAFAENRQCLSCRKVVLYIISGLPPFVCKRPPFLQGGVQNIFFERFPQTQKTPPEMQSRQERAFNAASFGSASKTFQHEKLAHHSLKPWRPATTKQTGRDRKAKRVGIKIIRYANVCN